MIRHSLALAVFLLAGILAAAPLRIGVEINSPPLSSRETNGPLEGYSIELIGEMVRAGDLEVELVEGYWRVITDALQQGKVDALANVTITPERRGFYDFSIGHARVRAVAYTREGVPPIRSSADLVGKKIAVLSGSVAVQSSLSSKGWGDNARLYQSYDDVFGSVLSGECDVAIVFRSMTAEPVKALPNLRSELIDDVTRQFHFAVRKGDSATLERINQALATVQAKGLDQPIYKRWIGPLEPRPIRLADLRPYWLPASLGLLAIIAVVTWRMISLAQRTRQAEALRKSETRFRSLFESTPNIAVQGYDRQRRVIFWNDASTQLYGYAREEALGRLLEDLIIPPAMRDSVLAAVDLWLKTGVSPRAEEITLHTKEGRPVKVFSSHCITANGAGDPEMYCIDIDLTERDQALAARRELEENFRRIVETAHEGIWTVDADGRTTFANPSIARMLGYTVEEMGSIRLLDTLDEEGRIFVSERLRLSETSVVQAHDVRFRRKDGSELWAAITTNPIHDTVGTHTGSLVMATDITGRKHAESQLRQSQKMEVVGQLAGGVAHDFNNILTAVMLNLNFLREIAPNPANDEILRDLEALTGRAAMLTSQLLSLARRQPLQMRPLELNGALTDLLRMLRRLIGEHIALQVKPDTPEVWIDADSGMLDQAVMNLCINARDAMPAGGTLTLSTRVVSLNEHNAALQPEARPGQFALIQITDTGQGMSPEVLQHLFEPFFTTKDVGKGTGLGLAAVHGIVHQHRGWIEVQSTPDVGSTFRIYLPVTSHRPATPVPAAMPVPRASATGRILYVEDEEGVRRVTAGMLARLGYDVVTASDGPDALKLWDQHAGAFQVLLTDVVMPKGVSGLQLGEMLRAKNPKLRVVLVSGYSLEINKARTQPIEGVAFLAKPFDSTALAETLRNCFI